MNRLVKLGAALGLLAATAVPATAMDLEFVIQNTGSDIISIVQVNGGDNLLDGEIEPGNSGTVYLTGLGDDDCDHTVSITTQNAAATA